jgi:hypothetical protein
MLEDCKEPGTPRTGDVVVFHDVHGKPHNALVTIGWSPQCCNLVVVASDANKQDQYGRQTERWSSVQHMHEGSAHGNYWRFPSETPKPYTPPAES